MYPMIQFYLEDFYDTITPLCVKTYPLMDFEFLVLDIEYASLYSSNTVV